MEITEKVAILILVVLTLGGFWFGMMWATGYLATLRGWFRERLRR